MRILIVSFQFPPFHGIACLRVGKTAKYLSKLGHDVRVLSARDQNVPSPTLPVEIPEENVVYTHWINPIDPLVKLFSGNVATPQGALSPGARETPPTLSQRLRRFLRELVRSILMFPDREAGWYPFAVIAGAKICKEWKPDLIYASSFPASSLLVACSLSRKFGIPWVAEMRDLWADFQYYQFGRFRRWIDDKLERKVLGTATALVTVSEPLAENLRAKYGKPTEVVMHGFDPVDYCGNTRTGSGARYLRIVYTGNIYHGVQNPELLFEAVRFLGPKAEGIRIVFYGHPQPWVIELCKSYGIVRLVEFAGVVANKEALRAQCEADLLLVLLWNDPKEPGMYLSKSLEYLGARRPILAVGCSENGAAQLIVTRRAGMVLDNSTAIAQQLGRWMDQKVKDGAIPELAPSVGAGLSREEQTFRLHEFLKRQLSVASGEGEGNRRSNCLSQND